MKRNYLTFAALASIVLASCTNDELAGDSLEVSNPEAPQAIAFSSGFKNISRADLYGSDAAAKLGNKFVVYGTKHIGAAESNAATNDNVVFNNFQVKWTTGTAGKTESNSSDWEYVGLQSYDNTPSSQGIKYWDYNAEYGHTFYAFSSSDISFPKNDANKVQVTKVTSDGTTLYNKGYQVTVKNGASLENLYFSDRVEVPKSKYEQTVSFTFRNLGAKVRFGFYETIPGYHVKIDKFYFDDDANPNASPATAPVTTFPAMNVGKADGFYASLQNVKTGVDQNLNVTYYASGTEINHPTVSNPSGDYNWYLKLGDGTGLINTNLATTSSAPTWTDGATGGAYTLVFPFEGNTNPLLLKLDFTMIADDGSNDVIEVKGARAIVPAQYVQWKSNFAYTYIFKISDKTNGTTGEVDANGDPTDPEGLKPITFDAITVDVTEERQETISSISTNSITTYAEGKIVNEYNVGKPIYVAVSNTTSGAIIEPSAIGTAATEAQVYKLSDAFSEADVFAKLTGSPIEGLTLTALTTPAATVEDNVPLADGSKVSIKNVKFTPSASGYYAYVYTTTAYVAPTYAVQTSGAYVSSNTYYMLSGSGAYYAVSVPTEAAFEANKTKLYLQTAAGTPGVYDVKVIKVQ